MQFLENEELCPTLNFELRRDTKGNVEHLLFSLMNQREKFIHDRKYWKQEEIEEVKKNLQINLKKLIHQAAQKAGIDSTVEEKIIKGLLLNLKKINREKSLPNFNKQLLIEEAIEEIKENHLNKLEKEFNGPLKHFISPRITYYTSKSSSDKELRKIDGIATTEENLATDNRESSLDLRHYFKSQKYVTMKGNGESTLSK